MVKNKKRPVFLNLLQIRLPVTGVVSIAHRVTGVLLVLAIPFFLYALQRSLADAQGFETVRGWCASGNRFVALVLLWLMAQHFFSGVRHLLLDLDVGIGLDSARASAWGSFAAAVALVVLVGALM
jgi:succinate dehydrogenase / fumarate reductase cytochrome b subunit